MERLIHRIDTLARSPATWWVWPAALVLLAVCGDLAAIVLQPLGDAWVAWPGGAQFGETCGMIVATGLPCPQCGMTRSWVHGIRGNLLDAFWFNPAGLALFFWMNVSGVMGAIRLFRGSAEAAKLPPMAFFFWIVFWLGPLYIGGYALRLAGFMPLP